MADQTVDGTADGSQQAKSPVEHHLEQPTPPADAQTVPAKVS
jgi:hypothetical protein